MTNVNTVIDWGQAQVDKLYGAPGWVLVVLACVVVGYTLKAIKAFPNSAIPLVVILFGGLANTLLRSTEPSGMGHRVWLMKNLLIGVILGFVAWMLHKKVLKKLEDKFPWLKAILPSGDTQFFMKTVQPPSGQPETSKEPNEKKTP